MEIIFKQNEIKEVASKILEKFLMHSTPSALVVALSGDLGAGKTTLTKEMSKIFEIKEDIISPTFVIMKKYDIHNKNFPWKNLIHIDAYRLEKDHELLRLGFEELSKDKDNLIIIEWPELVKGCLDSDTFSINLSHIDEETRKIEFCYNTRRDFLAACRDVPVGKFENLRFSS